MMRDGEMGWAAQARKYNLKLDVQPRGLCALDMNAN